MLNMIKTAALAALIGIGAIGATSTSAKADSLHIGVGGHGAHIGIGIGGGPHWGGGSRWGGGHRYRHCTPHRAVDKAGRMGLRRAHVTHVGHRTIHVRGFRHGYPARITFGRAPHCPVVHY